MVISRSSTSGFFRRHAAVLAVFLVLAAAVLASPGVIVTDYFDDMFVVMDLVWRSSLRQVPHIDFHSPIGQTFYWPFALASVFGEPSPLTLLHANLLMAFALLLFCMATLPDRLSRALYFLATASIIVTAIAPRDLDWGFNDYTHLAPYNRWGWSTIMLSAMLSVLPRRTPAGKGDMLMDGAVLGLLLALLFYLKINFFVAAVALALVGLVLRQLAWRTLLASFGTLLAVAVISELAIGNNLAYLRDINSALSANVEDLGSAKRLAQLRVSVVVGALYALLIGGAFWVWRPTLKVGAWLSAWWRPLLLCASIILAGAVLGTQNHNEFELALYATAAIVAAELAHRKLSMPEDTLFPSLAAGRVSLVLAGLRASGWMALLGAAAFMPLLDAVSVFAHSIEARSQSVCSLPGTEGTSFRKLLVLSPILAGGRSDIGRSGGPERFISARPGSSGSENRSKCEISAAAFLNTQPKELLALQAQQLVQGRLLIDRYGVEGAAVLALNFTNPYPAMLRSPPPQGALIWWDQRTFSEGSHPRADPLIRSAGIVLQGRVEAEQGASKLANTSVVNSAAMWPIYGSRISREFELVAQAPLWRMWVRKAGAGL